MAMIRSECHRDATRVTKETNLVGSGTTNEFVAQASLMMFLHAVVLERQKKDRKSQHITIELIPKRACMNTHLVVLVAFVRVATEPTHDSDL